MSRANFYNTYLSPAWENRRYNARNRQETLHVHDLGGRTCTPGKPG
jgi:hypothetical protein